MLNLVNHVHSLNPGVYVTLWEFSASVLKQGNDQ